MSTGTMEVWIRDENTEKEEERNVDTLIIACDGLVLLRIWSCIFTHSPTYKALGTLLCFLDDFSVSVWSLKYEVLKMENAATNCIFL